MTAITIRLADEGVPLRAIARATDTPSDLVRERLAEAHACGRLQALPKDDWPIGYPRDQRALQLSRLEVQDSDALLLAVIEVFGLPPCGAMDISCRPSSAAAPWRWCWRKQLPKQGSGRLTNGCALECGVGFRHTRGRAVARASGGGSARAPWAGRGHAIVDRLVSVIFRFEFEGLAGQSESYPMIVRSESDDPSPIR